MRLRVHNPLTLNGDRTVREGSFAVLNAAIRRGADLQYAGLRRNADNRRLT